MAKYQLLHVTAKGARVVKDFEAPTLKAACERHIEEWHEKKFPEALVMQLGDESRHSYTDSIEFIKEAGAA